MSFAIRGKGHSTIYYIYIYVKYITYYISYMEVYIQKVDCILYLSIYVYMLKFLYNMHRIYDRKYR